MAVMAEYLVRGWNVAIPEVDISDTKATCSGRNFTHYLNNWDKWPVIQH